MDKYSPTMTDATTSSSSTPQTAKLQLPDQEIDFPILIGTEGEKAVDIRALRKDTGFITYDPGYGNTGAAKSSITFLNGEKGFLRHRGYSIEDLAEQGDFVSVSYLLIKGELPNAAQLSDFNKVLAENCALEQELVDLIHAYPKNAHPMAVLISCLTAMSAIYPENTQVDDDTITKLLATVPGIIAAHHRISQGLDFIQADPSLGYTENFLHMLFGKEEHSEAVLAIMADALNSLLIVHADHEQNCSTSTARIVSSAQSNLFASISAGISALWGPLHGGANQKVMEMLKEIRDFDDVDLSATLERAKDKSDPFRLMGFGHRVYKTYDPRARIAKAASKEILKELGKGEQLVNIAMELEEVALNDEYFKSRNLYPNVDFYTGIIYRAMGFPTEMFTALFAMGRLPGWLAHVVELQNDPDNRIGRPRQIFMGENEREYTGLDER